MIFKGKKEVTGVPCICLLSYMDIKMSWPPNMFHCRLPCLAILKPPYGGHNVCTKKEYGTVKTFSKICFIVLEVFI